MSSSNLSEDRKIAIIAESMNAYGGGDRLLCAIHKLFPQSDVYCSIFNEKEYIGKIPTQLIRKIHPLWGHRATNRLAKSRLPSKLGKKLYKTLGYLKYETLDLSGYDIVISITSRFAKFVITPINCKHINFYLTPPGYEWDDARRILLKSNFIKNILDSNFRLLDISASSHADVNVSISDYIKRKVKKFYGINSSVIYPPVSDFWFENDNDKLPEKIINEGEYFLVVSRLHDYKRVDRAIRACIKADKRLVIIGKGEQERALKRVARGFENIQFKGYLSDDMVKKYYRSAQAVIFPGIEDFGLVPVEAQACGTPVIAYEEGGATKSVIAGNTGEFFTDVEELANILTKFDKHLYNREETIYNARSFSQLKFESAVKQLIMKA